MLVKLFLCLLLLHILKKWLDNRKYKDLKGPSPLLSLPMVGHGYLLGTNPAVKLAELHRRHGDIFRFDIGDFPTVVLNSYDLIKEAFYKEEFSGRHWNEIPSFRAIFPLGQKGNTIFGVGSGDGPVWLEQRRFMLKHLSDLGMGNKDTMEDVIEQEAEQYVDIMLRNEGPIKSKGMFLNAANNVIWRVATGRSTRQDDPALRELTNVVRDNFKNMDPTSPLALLQMNSLPFTRLMQWLQIPNFVDSSKKVENKLEAEILSSSADEGGNYIERCLAAKEEGGPRSALGGPDGHQHVVVQLADLFVAGTDTTATAMEWIFLYLIRHAEAQERMHQEITDLTGGNQRRIGLRDKVEAHFTNSFIDEVTRDFEMGVLPPAHKTVRDVVLRGIKIPKGTQVTYTMWNINHDEKHFPDPLKFDPERFLDKDGKYQRDDRIVFYGVGKRRCVGETLARSELFLFTASIVQRFRIKPAKGRPTPSMKSIPGLVFFPEPYEFELERREIKNNF